MTELLSFLGAALGGGVGVWTVELYHQRKDENRIHETVIDEAYQSPEETRRAWIERWNK